MAAPSLTHRCWHHAERLAVARCITCGRFYCRECVTEHEGRMICATCLRRGTSPARAGGGRRRVRALARGLQTAIALALVWWMFARAGHWLLRLPTNFHEGTVWSGEWWKDEP